MGGLARGGALGSAVYRSPRVLRIKARRAVSVLVAAVGSLPPLPLLPDVFMEISKVIQNDKNVITKLHVPSPRLSSCHVRAGPVSDMYAAPPLPDIPGVSSSINIVGCTSKT